MVFTVSLSLLNIIKERLWALQTHTTGVRNLTHTHTHIHQCSDLSNVPDNLQRIYLIASSYKQIN